MPGSTSVCRRDVIGWSLYDFANTIYSMNVVSLYLKVYVVKELGFGDGWYDIPFSISMLAAAILLPALGAVSDYSTRKKIFVLLFTLSCCMAVGLLSAGQALGAIGIAVLFIIANFSYEAAQPFYNALLYSVSDGRQARFVSGLGVSLGYVGSVVGMIVVLPFVTGDLFGLKIPGIDGAGKTAAFLPTAVLFLLFSLPLMLWVRERLPVRSGRQSIIGSYREIWHTLKDTRRYPGVRRFLIADYFIEDSVTTVIVNIALYCTLVLGMEDAQLNLFLIISTVTAVIGSFLFGLIARVWSLKRLLNLIVVGWVFALALFAFTSNMSVVWVLGSLVGVLLGGLWTTTRPMLGEMVPEAELGKFFGLFSLSGRAAAVVGPLIWTTVVYLLRPERSLGRLLSETLGLSPEAAKDLPYRAAVLSLGVILIIGLIILRKVPETSGADRGR